MPTGAADVASERVDPPLPGPGRLTAVEGRRRR